MSDHDHEMLVRIQAQNQSIELMQQQILSELAAIRASLPSSRSARVVPLLSTVVSDGPRGDAA